MKPLWATPTVIHLIAGVLIEGDSSKLSVLADALEDAGYTGRTPAQAEQVLGDMRACDLYALATLLRAIADECGFEQHRRRWAGQRPDHMRHYWAARAGTTAKAHVRCHGDRIVRSLWGVRRLGAGRGSAGNHDRRRDTGPPRRRLSAVRVDLQRLAAGRGRVPAEAGPALTACRGGNRATQPRGTSMSVAEMLDKVQLEFEMQTRGVDSDTRRELLEEIAEWAQAAIDADEEDKRYA